MRLSLALITVAALACGSCEGTLPPQGQVVLHLDTDAPVAESDDPLRPVALFDRVLVEIFPPVGDTPCVECARELVVDAEKMHASRFSFGFVPARPRETGWRARLRMFRSAGRATPRTESTIELVGFLPAVADEGITVLTATFRADDVGRPRGSLAAPIVFDRGSPSPSAVGTWAPARVVECSGATPPGAVCVPGGAFFMGDPRITIDSDRTGGAKEHLVVLSPFFLDAHEVTVAELRAAGVATIDSRGRAVDPEDDWDDTIGGECDYTSEPGPNEDLPVTCASHQMATKYCEARGGALPTEAQLEYVASSRGIRLAPWGEREPECDEAVVRRRLAPSFGGCDRSDPLELGVRVLPEPSGTGTRDRVVLPTGVVLDLGANLSEWTRDTFSRDDEPCWRDALLRDPACSDPSRSERSVKGGSLIGVPVDWVQVRRANAAQDPGYWYRDVGFRCAYPGNR